MATNRMQAPPTVRGVEEAFQLLAIIRDEKKFRSMVDDLKRYVAEVNEALAAYKGIDGAKDFARHKESEAKKVLESAQKQAGDIVNKANSLLKDAEGRNAEAKATADSCFARETKISEREQLVAQRERDVEKTEKELHKNKENIDSQMSRLEHERQELQKSREELETRVRRFNEMKSEVRAI